MFRIVLNLLKKKKLNEFRLIEIRLGILYCRKKNQVWFSNWICFGCEISRNYVLPCMILWLFNGRLPGALLIAFTRSTHENGVYKIRYRNVTLRLSWGCLCFLTISPYATKYWKSLKWNGPQARFKVTKYLTNFIFCNTQSSLTKVNFFFCPVCFARLRYTFFL